MKQIIYLLVGIAIFLNSCSGSGSRAAKEGKNASVLIDRSVIARIDSTLKSFVDSGDIAGVSALIYENDREVYFNTFGFADREAKIPMSRNTIVQIFSKTKPIPAVMFLSQFLPDRFLFTCIYFIFVFILYECEIHIVL
jgi:CubicO group peptidase (beta-lactamase class C family)